MGPRRPRGPANRFVVARFSVSGRIFIVVATLGMAAMSLPLMRTGTQPEMVGMAFMFGSPLAIGLTAYGARVDVRDGMLRVVNFFSVWHLPVWTVRMVSGDYGLAFVVDARRPTRWDPLTAFGVTAVQGALIEEMRGNPRANAAVRRFQNARAASGWIDPATHPPRRRFRWEFAAFLLAPPAFLVAATLLLGSPAGAR